VNLFSGYDLSLDTLLLVIRLLIKKLNYYIYDRALIDTKDISLEFNFKIRKITAQFLGIYYASDQRVSNTPTHLSMQGVMSTKHNLIIENNLQTTAH